MNTPCVDRQKLKDTYYEAMLDYVAKDEETHRAAYSGQPSEFKEAQTKESQANDRYKSAIHNFLKHREEHGC